MAASQPACTAEVSFSMAGRVNPAEALSCGLLAWPRVHSEEPHRSCRALHCTDGSAVRTLKLRIEGTGPDAGTSQGALGGVTPDGEAESCCCWGWTGNKLCLTQAQQQQEDRHTLAGGVTNPQRRGMAPYVHRPASTQHCSSTAGSGVLGEAAEASPEAQLA